MEADIGERIRHAREQLGINRNQMARELGTSWQHVQRWETGRTAPSTDSLAKIAALLNVTVGHLLGHGETTVGPSTGLQEFLATFAPADLTEAEERWLRTAPVESGSPGMYVDILHALRNGARPRTIPPRQDPAQSGTHARVIREEILEKLKEA
ncbi:MAG: helix-turn-helix transcriptional regulator [Myxococcota bacterium]